MENPLKVRLHILSPVHIGCDDVYEPTSFVIDEHKQILIEFDPLKLIYILDQKEKAELEKVSMGDDLINIFKFIKKAYKPQVGDREVEVVPALLNQYKKILSMSRFDRRTVINQFEISRTAYNSHDNIPYIPGSSLKGALRTAYLSKIAKDKGVKNWWEMPGRNIRNKRLSKELEENLLDGKFHTDPFRLVKVSDLQPVNGVKTKIVYAVNKKKKQSRFAARGPFQILETIQEGEVFEGVINIQKPERSANISNPVTRETVLNSLDYFYKSICETEDGTTLKNIDASSKVLNTIRSRYKDTMGTSTFLVRIGRHSGAESVTIENNRYIKIMQGRGTTPKYSDQATTIWLASDTPSPNSNSDLLPFGWAILTIV
jgi:CRISPR-associated protein Csm5